jgi:hypothetical protein
MYYQVKSSQVHVLFALRFVDVFTQNRYALLSLPRCSALISINHVEC